MNTVNSSARYIQHLIISNPSYMKFSTVSINRIGKPLVYAYREANRCADFLANHGHYAKFECVLVDTIFPSLDLSLANNVRACVMPHLVP